MNWNPDDRALCIKSGTRTTSGSIYIVLLFFPKGTPIPGTDKVLRIDCLILDGVNYPPGGVSNAKRFIKIDPKTAPDIELEKELV